MYVCWNDSGELWMIQWQPADVLNGKLLGLIVEGEASVICCLLGLLHCLIKAGIAPLTMILARRCKSIWCQQSIGVWEIRAPLAKTKLDLVSLCLFKVGIGFK